MTEYIIAVITAITSFFGAAIASWLSIKKFKREKYFEEKKRLYYELATILPIANEFVAQSDYLDGTEGCGEAECKIDVMALQLKIAKERLDELKKKNVSSDEMYEVEVEINNLKYKMKKHEQYLKQMNSLHTKIEEFEKAGNRNLLRIFASQKVWNSYVRFNVALHNEYYSDIGVTKEDIIYHINRLIAYMRKDLASGEK